MALWHAEMQDTHFNSLPTLVAGRAQMRPDVPHVYDFVLSPKLPSDGTHQIDCRIHLDLSQYFFQPDGASAQYIGVESDGQIDIAVLDGTHSRTGKSWSVPHSPDNLGAFSELWDIFASNPQAAMFSPHTERTELIQGAISDNDKMYRVTKVIARHDLSHTLPTETGIAPVEEYADYKIETHDSTGNLRLIPDRQWIDLVNEWKQAEFETAAATVCSKDLGSGKKRSFLFVFPVMLWTESLFWTEMWLNRAISEKYVPAENHLRMNNRTRLNFADAFPNLTREATGLETLNLAALQRWLEQQSTEMGPSIEVAGIRIPRALLRLVGIFVIGNCSPDLGSRMTNS